VGLFLALWHQSQLSIHLIAWICDYLTSRTQNVLVNGSSSTAMLFYLGYLRVPFWGLLCQ